MDNDGEVAVVLGTTKRILVLKGKDGGLEWSRPFDGPMCLGVARFGPGEKPDIFVSDHPDVNLNRCYRLDGRDGSELWEFVTVGSAYNKPAIADINGDGQKEILFHSHRWEQRRETEFCLTSGGKELWRYDAEPSEDQNAQAPPELGYVPDFGYVSTIVGDFMGNGELQVFFATRCHAYLLTAEGELIWRYPLVKGFGVHLSELEGGKIEADYSGTGGFADCAAAGDVNGDGCLDVVMAVDPEYRVLVQANGKMIYQRVERSNRVFALSGKTGEVLWSFEGNYPDENGLDRMYPPILLDLDGNGIMDVVIPSSDGYLYGLHGPSGECLWKYDCVGMVKSACVLGNSVFLVISSGDLTLLELAPRVDR